MAGNGHSQTTVGEKREGLRRRRAYHGCRRGALQVRRASRGGPTESVSIVRSAHSAAAVPVAGPVAARLCCLDLATLAPATAGMPTGRHACSVCPLAGPPTAQAPPKISGARCQFQKSSERSVQISAGRGRRVPRAHGTGVPAETAVDADVEVPTIGIGAGNAITGPVLVWQDMAGLRGGRMAKFVKQYSDLRTSLAGAAKAYGDDVRSG